MKYLVPVLWAITWPIWVPAIGIAVMSHWLVTPNEFLSQRNQDIIIAVLAPIALVIGCVIAISL